MIPGPRLWLGMILFGMAALTLRDLRATEPNPDIIPPLLASGYVLRNGMVELNFNEDMDPDQFDTFGMSMHPTAEGPGSIHLINLSSGVLTHGTTWMATTLEAVTPGVPYSIYIGPGAVRDISGNSNNEINQDLGSEILMVAIDETTRWTYDASGLDLGTTPDTPFHDPAFDDSDWLEGAALFGRAPSPTVAPIRTPVSSPSQGGPVTTYYRKRFYNPFHTVEWRLNTVLDDGAIVYLNGAEVLRLRMPEGAVTHQTVATALVEEAVWEGPFHLPGDMLGPGENVLAVEVHQYGVNDEDLLWGAELSAMVMYEVFCILPAVRLQPAALTVTEGEPFEFSLTPYPCGFDSILWYHEDVLIPGADGQTLSAAHADLASAGTYTAEVTDQGQTHRTSATLTVLPALRLDRIEIDAEGHVWLHHNAAELGGEAHVQWAEVFASPSGEGISWTTYPNGPHASPFDAGPAEGMRFFRLSDAP